MALVVKKESQGDTYVFETYKVVKDKNGQDVEIIDRQEKTTIERLNQDKARLTADLAKVQAKLDAIAALESAE